jgi:gliding motility-associated-like protein
MMMKYFNRIVLALSILTAPCYLTGQHGWTVNPADFQYNGQVNVVIFLGPVEVTAGTLGAFVGEECRGFIDGTVFTPTLRTTFNLICYSDAASGEKLSFRYYDPVKKSFYDITETVEFEPEMNLGNDEVPLEFHISLCDPVTITTQPENANMCAGTGNASFSVVAGGSEPFLYQWEYNNGSVWVNVSNGIPAGAVYTNQTTATMGVSGITAAGGYQYRCYVTNCEAANNETSSVATLTVNAAPATPGTISGTTTQCPGLTGQAYSISAVTNATTYTWAVPTGWSITGGQGTTAITVTTGSAGQNGNISVTAGNTCGTSAARNLAVTVSPGAPAQPGSIVGTTTQCPGLTGQAYSISAVTNATTYTWAVPTGWSITGGQGTTAITVTTGSAGQNGNISVTAGNSCGISAARTLAVTVSPGAPAQPGTITGTSAQCPGLTGQAYSISVVTNATTYTWAVPTGWSITGGQGTTAVTVTTGSAGQNGNISVTAGNSCGTSTARTFAVTVSSYPSAPTIGTITPPTCNLSTGSVVLNGLPTSGTWIVNSTSGGIIKTGTGTSTTISGLNSGTYNFTVTNQAGCTSPASGNAVIPVQPPTPDPPTIGTITPPTCTLSTGSVVLSGLPTSDSWTLRRYPGAVPTTGSGASTTISGLASNTYNYTVTNSYGCVSGLSENVEIPAAPTVPTAPLVGTITHPTCEIATGSVILNGLPSGNWSLTRTPGGSEIAGSGTTTLVTGLSAGSFYTFRVTNSDNCTSPESANVVINSQPPTPTAPVIGTITQPTCALAAGSVALSGLPSTGNWFLTRSPGDVTTTGSGTTTLVTGLTTNKYTFTVRNASGCTSPSSADVVINTQPPSPTTPVQTINCSLGAGNAVVTVTSPTGAGLSYRLDAGDFQTSNVFSGVANGNHTITVMNASKCTTTGAPFSVSCGCANPPTLTLNSTSGSTCGTAAVTVSGNTFGGSATSVIITGNGSGTLLTSSTSVSPFSFQYTPAAGDAGKIVTITVTTNNPLGVPCNAATAEYSLTVNAIPAAPSVGTRTHPTCTVTTGSVILNGLPSVGTWTLTRSPGSVVTNGTGTSTTITGLVPETYTFTVTSAAGCTSASSANVVINDQPPTPTPPVIGTLTQPTCATSTGSVQLTGLPASGSWTVTRLPDGATRTGSGTSVTITGIPQGTYTFTVINSFSCVSAPSVQAVINEQPPIPSAPSVGTITPPTCALATGSVVLLGLPPTGTWTITRYPGTVTTTGTGTSRTISDLPSGTYNFTVTNEHTCLSVASANVVIPAQPPTPTAPIIGTITQPTFSVPTGSVVLSGLPSSGTWSLTRFPGEITTSGTGTSRTITELPAGVFTFTVTNSVGCTSPLSNQVIISTPGIPVLTITDPPAVCSPLTVDLTDPAITDGSTPGLTYTYWTDAGATVAYPTPGTAGSGTYYIKGTTVSGFFDIKPVVVTVDQRPVANAGPAQVLEYRFETKLDAQLSGNETGVWTQITASGSFADTRDPKTTVTNLIVGTNIFRWTVTNGVCPAVFAQVIITVNDLTLPTLITPNMDGKNDYFVIRGIETLGKTEITIFDRRGLQVYKSSDYNNDWDGVDYNNNPLPDDTYFYVLKAANGRSLSGYIVIRR